MAGMHMGPGPMGGVVNQGIQLTLQQQQQLQQQQLLQQVSSFTVSFVSDLCALIELCLASPWSRTAVIVTNPRLMIRTKLCNFIICQLHVNQPTTTHVPSIMQLIRIITQI